MWNKIYNWLVKYNFEISWFLTGWFAAYFLVDFSHGNWVGCLIDAVLVALNIKLAKR